MTTAEDAARLVQRTAVGRGLPAVIDDPTVLAQLATLTLPAPKTGRSPARAA